MSLSSLRRPVAEKHNPRFFRQHLEELLTPSERAGLHIEHGRRAKLVVPSLNLKVSFPTRTGDRHSLQNWRHHVRRRLAAARSETPRVDNNSLHG